MSIEIAQIQNAALKAAALEIDEVGKKDGYIDASEINLFTEKATTLLNDKKCTAQEFAAIFVLQGNDKTATESDMFAKVDNASKNSPEVSTTDFSKLSQAELEEKFEEINDRIIGNNSKITLLKHRMKQPVITYDEYHQDLGQYRPSSRIYFNSMRFSSAAATVAIPSAIIFCETCAAAILSPLAIGTAAVAILSAIGLAVEKVVHDSNTDKKEIREAYKEACEAAIEENEKLKPQLEEIKKYLM